jgi:hypothetical protein|tara:strand:+ start:352 stop:1335 length:984 start_codon:yes stop_codon:yes gene_type:complete
MADKKSTESKSEYFPNLGEFLANQEMEQALKEDDGSDWEKKEKEIEQAFTVLSNREEQKKKLRQRKDMSEGFRPKEPEAFGGYPWWADPRLEKPALHPPTFDYPQNYSIGKVPRKETLRDALSDAPKFLLAGIHEWTKDGVEAGKQIGEMIAKEAKEAETDIKEFVSYLKILEDPLPAKAFIGYLADSAKARIKAGLNPTQAEVDAQRTFTPLDDNPFTGEPLITDQHIEVLDKFIRNTNTNEWENSDKGKGWSSLDLLADKYKPLLAKDPKLRAMAWTLGKVSFKKDPKTNTITYADRYDFGDKEIIGPSVAPEFTIKGPTKKTEI